MKVIFEALAGIGATADVEMLTDPAAGDLPASRHPVVRTTVSGAKKAHVERDRPVAIFVASHRTTAVRCSAGLC
jgi:hypothetical protein